MWLKQGQIEVDGGDGDDYDGNEYGDSHAEKTNPAAIPIPNQSKPIVPTPSLSPTPSHSRSL